MEMLTKLSPMFKHAIESFEHGLEHHLDSSPKSRKFALLHIDQSIELILKEKIVRIGKSIYKTDGSTLNLHESFKSLKELKLPEKPRIEELHDLRNTVQHKGLTPDLESTKFYVEAAYSFFKRFLNEELNTPLDQTIQKNYIALMEGQPVTEAIEAEDIFKNALQSNNATEKIIYGYNALNSLVDSINKREVKPGGFRGTIRKIAESRGHNYSNLKPFLADVMRIRSQTVHSDHVPTDDEAGQFMNSMRSLLSLMGYDWTYKPKLAKNKGTSNKSIPPLKQENLPLANLIDFAILSPTIRKYLYENKIIYASDVYKINFDEMPKTRNIGKKGLSIFIKELLKHKLYENQKFLKRFI